MKTAIFLSALTAFGLSAMAGFSSAHAQTTFTVEAGPIWNQTDAQQVCPALARQYNMVWTGQWWTTQWNVMSVCQLRPRMLGEPAG